MEIIVSKSIDLKTQIDQKTWFLTSLDLKSLKKDKNGSFLITKGENWFSLTRNERRATKYDFK